jgi:hypothetical protein
MIDKGKIDILAHAMGEELLMPISGFDQMLRNLRNALPPRVKCRVNSIIFQMKANRSPSTGRPMLLRQLRSLFPKITKEQRGLLAIYILGEAGLLGNPGSATSGNSVSLNNISAAISSLQNTLDADNEISEMGSMQLQMLMDTRSKLLQTASDMEKSMSDTDMAIVGNIKQ